MAVTTIMARAAGTAGTAFESRATRTSAVWTAVATAIRTATTTIRASTATTIAISSATLRALETGAGIAAADTGGIAWKIFPRNWCARDTRGAGFSGEQNDVVFDDCSFADRFASGGFDDFCFGVFEHDVFGVTEGYDMLGALVCGVGFEFGAIGGTARFNFGGFFFGEFGLGSGLIFRGVEFGLLLPLFFFGFFFLFLGEFGFAGGANFLGLVFVEFGATCESIGFRVIGGFLVFCLGKFGRERHGLFFAQLDFGAEWFSGS